MKDEYGRVQTYAQALREMNTSDMSKFFSNLIDHISGVKIGYKIIQEKLEQSTEDR